MYVTIYRWVLVEHVEMSGGITVTRESWVMVEDVELL